MYSYSIFRRYSPDERWASIFYGIKSKLELQTKMKSLSKDDCYLQIRDKESAYKATYLVKSGKATKVTDQNLIEDHPAF